MATGRGHLGATSQLAGAELYLARQKVHLGDRGHVSVQARELHAGSPVAEGDGLRAERSRYPSLLLF